MRKMDEEFAKKKEQYLQRVRKVKDGEALFLKKQEDMAASIKQFQNHILDTDNKKNRFAFSSC